MFFLTAIGVGVFLIIAVVSGIRQGNLASKALQLRRDQARAFGQAILNGLSMQCLPIAEPRHALMRPGEEALAIGPAHLLETKTIGYKRSGTSVNYRLTKGVSVGSYSGHSSAVKTLMRTSNGEFVVTTQRVIFAGDAKSFEIQLKRLTNIEPYTDGLGLHHGTTTHIVKFDAAELADAMGRVLKLVAEGKLKIASPIAAISVPATIVHPV
jgi:hypothetical protein